LVAGSALSTPLAAQHAFALGVAATVGGSWQIEAVDLGWVQQVHAGPFRSVSIGGRFGAFVDEGAVIGGARGFVAGLVLQGRTGLLQAADVGNETNPSSVGFDVSLEGVAYGAANTALPQFGSAWGAVSVLPGLRFGNPQTLRAGVVFGPTLFFGHETDVRPFLAFRFELPMTHRKRQP
jgi:hypothetical protein